MWSKIINSCTKCGASKSLGMKCVSNSKFKEKKWIFPLSWFFLLKLTGLNKHAVSHSFTRKSLTIVGHSVSHLPLVSTIWQASSDKGKLNFSATYLTIGHSKWKKSIKELFIWIVFRPPSLDSTRGASFFKHLKQDRWKIVWTKFLLHASHEVWNCVFKLEPDQSGRTGNRPSIQSELL